MSVEITINGIAVKVPKGVTVLEAARKAGFEIPTLCHHPALSDFGACRLCVVEIKGMRNLAASCVTKVREGMEIETESEQVIEARKTILELLLANHPNDCLTCQKSGDCELQEYAYKYQVKDISFQGETHDYPVDDSNPYIFKDSNKCILCGRCVRACSEIKGENVLYFTGRGFNTKITTAFDRELKDSSCEFCHNCVAVCPTGALMDREMMNKGRYWEMERKEVFCGLCENGCQFELYFKDGNVIGVSAQPGNSEGRPCLKGRLAVHFKYNPEKTDKPLIKKDGDFVPVPWEEALGISEIVNKIKELESE